MATYKKQLRDKDNNIIYPAQGLGTITSDNIDWTTTAQSYSTTEMDTGATWIDGKHIYKKTINCGALPNATTKTVAHGISNIGLVVKYEAIATYGSNSTQIPIPFVSDNLYAQVALRVEANDIVLWCQVDRSPATSYVTLYYTKTID